jgi:hypothetical protein
MKKILLFFMFLIFVGSQPIIVASDFQEQEPVKIKKQKPTQFSDEEDSLEDVREKVVQQKSKIIQRLEKTNVIQIEIPSPFLDIGAGMWDAFKSVGLFFLPATAVYFVLKENKIRETQQFCGLLVASCVGGYLGTCLPSATPETQSPLYRCVYVASSVSLIGCCLYLFNSSSC